ncbi:ferredoxin [Streptomyces sp. NPDC004044]|uniref:ferredoxin n=1 Tax=Streptomyces sp. NPDC005356 TaxID=3157167 RepID=UPI0033BA9061
MKVILDRARCVSLGVCESLSDAFELNDDAELVVHEDRVATADLDELTDAVRSCPVLALSMEESA